MKRVYREKVTGCYKSLDYKGWVFDLNCGDEGKLMVKGNIC